ncbi:MAG TPA: hypothetical protein VLE96_02745 [Chlamydiales bacterium]|nr:hypothetical protein [Chlamydiales bacterium]
MTVANSQGKSVVVDWGSPIERKEALKAASDVCIDATCTVANRALKVGAEMICSQGSKEIVHPVIDLCTAAAAAGIQKSAEQAIVIDDHCNKC